MLTRQKILFRFLEQSGSSASKLYLMKWLFLLSKETCSEGGNAFYQFLPYQYGPFSFGVYQEIGAMVKKGLIEDGHNEKQWRLSLTEGESHTLPVEIEEDISTILSKYGEIPEDKLIDSVYKRYPWFTANSLMLDRRGMERSKAPIGIYTIGYEGLLIDGFLNKLMRKGIYHLIDVRANPVARKYGFHASTLKRLCENVGIKYTHIPKLGIVSNKRQSLESKADYEQLFEEYERTTLKENETELINLCKLIKSSPSALMCMEADPDYCHRTRIAKAAKKKLELEIKDLSLTNERSLSKN